MLPRLFTSPVGVPVSEWTKVPRYLGIRAGYWRLAGPASSPTRPGGGRSETWDLRGQAIAAALHDQQDDQHHLGDLVCDADHVADEANAR